MTDGGGIPLAAKLTGADRHDVTQVEALVQAIPLVAGRAGHPRKRPEILQGDRAYHSMAKDRWLRERHIRPLLAKRNAGHGSGLGKTRWVVERTISWLHQFRRLRVRYERRADIHEAFLTIGCALICWNCLIHAFC